MYMQEFSKQTEHLHIYQQPEGIKHPFLPRDQTSTCHLLYFALSEKWSSVNPERLGPSPGHCALPSTINKPPLTGQRVNESLLMEKRMGRGLGGVKLQGLRDHSKRLKVSKSDWHNLCMGGRDKSIHADVRLIKMNDCRNNQL